MRKKFALAGVILLLSAVIIYVFFRQDVIFLDCIKNFLPQTVKLSDSALTDFLLFNLSDGLWYASMLCFQTAIYNKTILSKFFLIIIIVLPFILETLQCMHIIPGTGDLFDFFTFLLTLIIFVFIMKNFKSISSIFLHAAIITCAVFTWIASGSTEEAIKTHNAIVDGWNSAVENANSYEDNIADSAYTSEQKQIKGDYALK